MILLHQPETLAYYAHVVVLCCKRIHNTHMQTLNEVPFRINDSSKRIDGHCRKCPRWMGRHGQAVCLKWTFATWKQESSLSTSAAPCCTWRAVWGSTEQKQQKSNNGISSSIELRTERSHSHTMRTMPIKNNIFLRASISITESGKSVRWNRLLKWPQCTLACFR